MHFIEFLILNGWIPYRKSFNKSKREWQYISIDECSLNGISDDILFFSSTTDGCIDIRLIKDNNEIIFGIPSAEELSNGKYKTHHPTLIYPNIFGTVNKTDEAFENMSYEEIYKLIEEYFNK